VQHETDGRVSAVALLKGYVYPNVARAP